MDDRNAGFAPRPAGIKYSFLGKSIEAVIAAGVGVVALLFARNALSTVFQTYDDEGYFLVALTHYLKQGHLYVDTYSQYGPFYFYAQEAVFRLLGLSVNHDNGRFVTLVCLMASGLLAGTFIYRLSRSLLLGAAAMLAYVRLESAIADQPGHPQQVILVLLTLAACLSVPACASRKSISLFLLGAVGAALAFTKINVGAFYFVALGQTLICVLPPGRMRKVGAGCMLACAVLVPVALMGPRLLDWAGGYCLVAVVSGGATFAWSALLRPDPPVRLRQALWAAAGAASAAASIVIATMLQGMSLSTLVQGVLLEPAKLGNVFARPLLIGSGQLIAAVVVVGGICLMGVFRDRLADHGQAVGALRCAVGLLAVFLLVHWPRLDWVVPFLPLAVIPVTGRTWRLSDLFPRILIASLAATQFLQAYPVAGTQMSIASAPTLLWAFVLIVDGIEDFHGAFGSRRLLENALSLLIVLVTAA